MKQIPADDIAHDDKKCEQKVLTEVSDVAAELSRKAINLSRQGRKSESTAMKRRQQIQNRCLLRYAQFW